MMKHPWTWLIPALVLFFALGCHGAGSTSMDPCKRFRSAIAAGPDRFTISLFGAAAGADPRGISTLIFSTQLVPAEPGAGVVVVKADELRRLGEYIARNCREMVAESGDAASVSMHRHNNEGDPVEVRLSNQKGSKGRNALQRMLVMAERNDADYAAVFLRRVLGHPQGDGPSTRESQSLSDADAIEIARNYARAQGAEAPPGTPVVTRSESLVEVTWHRRLEPLERGSSLVMRVRVDPKTRWGVGPIEVGA